MEAEGQLISVAGMGSSEAMLDQLEQAISLLHSGNEKYLQLLDSLQWENVKANIHLFESSYKSKLELLKQKQQDLEEKKLSDRTLIAERESLVCAKEAASKDVLQELKDDAVIAITNACEKHKVELPEILDNKGAKNKKVKTSLAEPNAPSSVVENSTGLRKPSEDLAVPSAIKPCPLLKQICESMDAKSLLKFLSDNSKKLPSLHDEFLAALKCAPKPAQLVLDSLEDFGSPNESDLEVKKGKNFQVRWRISLLLMESMADLLATNEPGVDHLVSSELTERAKAIAEEWRPNLAEVDVDASNGFSLEAQAFLQLLATFKVAEMLGEDELCKIIFSISRRKQAPELCRSLGLTERVPGIIEGLLEKDRKLDAVGFIQIFGLSERYPLVPLLQSYVDEIKDMNEASGGNNTNSLRGANGQEMSQLKAVIKCIEDYKLQKVFPLGPLQRRVAALKSMATKRHFLESPKFKKRQKVFGSYAAPIPTVADTYPHANQTPLRFAAANTRSRPPVAYDASGYSQYSHPATTQHQRVPQYAGEGGAALSYASGYHDSYAGASAQSVAAYYNGYGAAPTSQPVGNSYGTYPTTTAQPTAAQHYGGTIQHYGSTYAGSGYAYQPPYQP